MEHFEQIYEIKRSPLSGKRVELTYELGCLRQAWLSAPFRLPQ